MSKTLPMLRKSFYICILFSILILVCVLVNQIELDNDHIFNGKTVSVKKKAGVKYILLWTSSDNILLVYMGDGQQGFIDRRCPYTNCFVTGDRNYLDDPTKFDVIAFTGPEVVRMGPANLPQKRLPSQKFVFLTRESSDYYPICSSKFDGYFNWTWTFKLNSDARLGYIVVKDANKNVIGPRIDMHWMKFEDMDPVSDELKEKLKTKTKAAAWFVSNCRSKSGRESFVKELQYKLREYGLKIDIYGDCGTFSCPVDTGECFKMIEKDYYFYLSFENSFSEDYVTEKLLTGLKHTALPIVYGGANYTRFMPDGIYLNARELGVNKLAAKMYKLIENPSEYAEYFRWKKYYSYHDPEESIETNDYCKFCSVLFDEDLMNKTTIYDNFRQWWDPPDSEDKLDHSHNGGCEYFYKSELGGT